MIALAEVACRFGKVCFHDCLAVLQYCKVMLSSKPLVCHSDKESMARGTDELTSYCRIRACGVAGQCAMAIGEVDVGARFGRGDMNYSSPRLFLCEWSWPTIR